MDCNQLAVDIDNEIVVVYNFLRDRYKTKFPELESLVHNPLDYARVVQVGARRGAGGPAQPGAELRGAVSQAPRACCASVACVSVTVAGGRALPAPFLSGFLCLPPGLHHPGKYATRP